MTDTNQTYYEVPEARFSWLKEQIAKINKRAARHGLTPVKLVIVGEHDKPIKDPHTDEVKEIRRYIHVEVEGETVVINGWRFCAALEHADEAGTVIRSVPGVEVQIPVEYRNAKPENCDHCKTIRRRVGTFVLHHEESGEWKQVGRQCLRDFLGHDPERAARAAEILFGVNELLGSDEDFGGGRNDRRVYLPGFLAYVSAAVLERGWLSRTKARELNDQYGTGRYEASADTALRVMFAGPTAMDNIRRDEPELIPSEKHYEYGVKALEWARDFYGAKDPVTLNDFEHNILVVARQEAITHKMTGIAAAIVFVYRREVEKEVLRKRQADLTKDSKHVGKEGERILAKITLLATSSWEGNYGTTFFSKMIDEGGNVLVWFGSSPIKKLVQMPPREEGGQPYYTEGDNLGQGETAYIAATVKRHDTRDGVAQTIVNRVTVCTEEGYQDALAKAERKRAREAKKAAKAAQVQEKFKNMEDEQW